MKHDVTDMDSKLNDSEAFELLIEAKQKIARWTLWELWLNYATEEKKSGVAKLMKERYKTFKQTRDGIEGGDFDWLLVRPRAKQ